MAHEHNDNLGTIFMDNPWLLRKSQNYQYFSKQSKQVNVFVFVVYFVILLR